MSNGTFGAKNIGLSAPWHFSSTSSRVLSELKIFVFWFEGTFGANNSGLTNLEGTFRARNIGLIKFEDTLGVRILGLPHCSFKKNLSGFGTGTGANACWGQRLT